MLPEVDPIDEFSADIHVTSQPERRLFCAILVDAIVRFRHLAAAPRHVRRELIEAERWIRSDDRQWPCSFVNVCEALDIAYEPLRRAVLQWRTKQDGRSRVTRRGLLVKASRSRAARSPMACAETGEAVSTPASSVPRPASEE
ncbi:MAG: hypothetical protein ABI080_04030 [Candidatus Binatia bacterium]